MKKIFIITLLILIVFTCKEAPTDVPEIITKIAGKVTDGQTNQPLVGVQITTAPVTSSIITGQDGNFTIPDINPGQYKITAKKDDYNDNTTTVTVEEGKTVNADIQMFKLGPELAVSIETLDFNVALTNLTFNILNKTKVGVITWEIYTNQSWLIVIPKSGTTNSETDVISVNVKRDSLDYGNYSGLITIKSDYGIKEINVIMTK